MRAAPHPFGSSPLSPFVSSEVETLEAFATRKAREAIALLIILPALALVAALLCALAAGAMSGPPA